MSVYFCTFSRTFHIITKSAWQKSALYLHTFPASFHLFLEGPSKKVSFTSTPFQALFIFSQQVPGKIVSFTSAPFQALSIFSQKVPGKKKVPGSQDPRIPHILHPCCYNFLPHQVSTGPPSGVLQAFSGSWLFRLAISKLQTRLSSNHVVSEGLAQALLIPIVKFGKVKGGQSLLS